MPTTKKGAATAATATTPPIKRTERFIDSITENQEAVQEKRHLRNMHDVAMAFTQKEWDTVIAIIPSKRLAAELVERATRGEKAYKQMRQIWEDSRRGTDN